MRYRNLELYPFQEAAIHSIESGKSVIVSAPTGAGKTIIAEYAIDESLRLNQRIIYTSPIKALSNQKYRDFKASYGDRVGIMTGDVTLNGNAPILIMTTEIFRNTIFEDSGRLDNIGFVIFDEVHYLGDQDRGSVWEESIIFAPPNIRFICLSATISNLEELRSWMVSVRNADVELVHTDERPVPLHSYLFLDDTGVFEPRELKPILGHARKHARPPSPRDRHSARRHQGRRDLVHWLVQQDKLPVLYFSFSRRKCEMLARRYARMRLLSSAEERTVVSMFDDLIERFGAKNHASVSTMRESVRRGVLYHHAGMLPVYKDVVERLFTSGLVKLLFTTETFALGVNMPARCVVFDSLSKWNGVSVEHITSLDYRQMAGRAGRQGIDTEGEVYSILDPHYDTPKVVGEILFRKPGSISSRFALGYSTILNLKRLVNQDIEDAVRRSFAVFQQHSAKRPLESLRARLDVLKDRHYLDDSGLTGKGSFCSKINGFEIQLTELYWEGCFEELDSLQAAVLCASIIFEPRKSEAMPRVSINPVPENIINRANKRVQEFRRSESKSKTPDIIRPLDFSMAAMIVSWFNGDDFGHMRRRGNMQDGDLVRAFRLTIQVLRQLAWALPPDTTVAETCMTAIRSLNRDEIDAERQLQIT